MKTLQFSNLICVIWCILFGNIPNRRKDHHLDDSPFSDNLNRIDIRSSYDRYSLIYTWIKYRSYILTSQSVLCHHVSSSFFCLFFLSSCFFFFFFLLFVFCFVDVVVVFFLFSALFSCLYLLTVLRGCFTRIGLIHLSLLLPSPFLSFFSSLFSFSFSFFLSSLLFLFSHSPCRFLVRRSPPCHTASDGPASLDNFHKTASIQKSKEGKYFFIYTTITQISPIYFDYDDFLSACTGWVKKTAIIMKGEIKDSHITLIYYKCNLCERLF